MERQEIRFGFKETTKKDADGKVVNNEKGEPIKIPAHPPAIFPVPQLTLNRGPDKEENGKIIPTFLPVSDDLKAIMNSGDDKLISLCLEAINEVILKHAKIQLDDAIREGKNVWPKFEKQKDKDGKEVEIQVEPADNSWIDYDKLDLAYISKLPPATRGAQGIPEESWEAFAKDYKEIIVHHGKTPAQAEAGAKHFLNKFAIIRLNKPLLANMQKNLHLWYANSELKEDSNISKIYENLASKLETLLQADEDAIQASV